MTKQLSIAAQAVLDAAVGTYEPNVVYEHQISIAAALRAAAQQTGKRKTLKVLGVTMAQGPVYCLISDLLAIADELEGQ